MLNTIIPNTSINDLQKDLFIQTKFRMGKEDYSDIELLKYLSLYYNDNITIYNSLLRKFPSNIIATFGKYKEKLFFDRKDMNDDDYDDFKL